jgi:hypothetical protein
LKAAGAVILAAGGTLAAAVGSFGHVVEANRVMLVANLAVIALSAVHFLRSRRSGNANSPACSSGDGPGDMGTRSGNAGT